MDKRKFRPECIWNIDATGCFTVQKPQRQLAKKGEICVGSIVSHENGRNITLCGAVNAIGKSIPPFLIFPRVNVQDHWTLSAQQVHYMILTQNHPDG
ncbi:tigger transposable element-derived 4-like protein [Plakobranchus ocellatus]|uniref:Tigger transposable element-derived 4-like protein n=1 Tax=Plakobranchus ocellatus TaxID=259542 RepID=A0AAV4DL44_9GAST|nr:tigger transposable element-derived 4-like protein [Plakobranchus ocellatus]